MKASAEKKQIDKQFKTVKGHVKQFVKSADQEELHQFRVGIKKLKAFLFLLQSHSQNRHLLKRFKPVRKIFKIAGNIRNAHINLSLSTQYRFDSDKFISQQHQVMETATRNFCKKGKQYLKKIKQAKKSVLSHIHDLENRYVHDFYRDHINAVALYLRAPEFDLTLHDCRKKIKLLLYNYKLADQSVNRHLQLNTQYLDDLQESIGAWHDNALALDLAEQVDPDNKTALQQLQQINLSLQSRITILAGDFMRKATDDENEMAMIQPS